MILSNNNNKNNNNLDKIFTNISNEQIYLKNCNDLITLILYSYLFDNKLKIDEEIDYHNRLINIFKNNRL